MDNIEEKQNCLRAQIIEKGYEQKDFVTFLTHKRGEDGADINQWTFLDLKIVCEIIITFPKVGCMEFKVMYMPAIKQKKEDHIIENEDYDNNTNTNNNNSANANSNGNIHINQPENKSTNIKANSVLSPQANSNAKDNNSPRENLGKEDEIKEIVSDLPKELSKETSKEEETKNKSIDDTLQCKLIETTVFLF